MIALAGCLRLMGGARKTVDLGARAHWELGESDQQGVLSIFNG